MPRWGFFFRITIWRRRFSQTSFVRFWTRWIEKCTIFMVNGGIFWPLGSQNGDKSRLATIGRQGPEGRLTSLMRLFCLFLDKKDDILDVIGLKGLIEIVCRMKREDERRESEGLHFCVERKWLFFYHKRVRKVYFTIFLCNRKRAEWQKAKLFVILCQRAKLFDASSLWKRERGRKMNKFPFFFFMFTWRRKVNFSSFSSKKRERKKVKEREKKVHAPCQ